jgi:hypothetical protein
MGENMKSIDWEEGLLFGKYKRKHSFGTKQFCLLSLYRHITTYQIPLGGDRHEDDVIADPDLLAL